MPSSHDTPVGTPAICFVALNSYNLLARSTDLAHIGGAELQQTLVARELHRRGYRVSFVTADHGQADGIDHDGIRAFKTCSADEGIPVVRFIHPRWTSLWRAMSRANADIYYQRTGGLETGQVAMYCRRRHCRFVFAAAVDYDCDARLEHLEDRRSRLLYRYGLRHADRVITQSETQRAMLSRHYGLRSTVIRSCGLDPGQEAVHRNRPAGNPRVLWLGRFCKQKGLERLLDLAAACPDYGFDLIGNDDLPTDYARSIRTRASGMNNVHLIGWVPNERVDPYYRRSSFVVCTSHFEGFPNTFLEAWSRGVPVVTTIDPDGVVAANELGVVSDDVRELARQMRRAVESDALWGRWSANARRYFLDHHTVDAAAAAYEKLFCELVEGAANRPAVCSRTVATQMLR